MEYIVESALLTHGLRSVGDDAIAEAWPAGEDRVAWVDRGRVMIGGIEDYLPFRNRAAELARIDCYRLAEAEANGASGALTASGTMAVCARLGVRLAVTCGMGGIGDIKGEELCPDLPALRDIPVSLLSTGPKDMLDRAATVAWLRGEGVRVLGATRDVTTGYVLVGDPVALDGTLPADPVEIRREVECARLLILNEIPEAERWNDPAIIEAAVRAGKEAEARGAYFHPAANAKIDELTGGESSFAQLRSLVANVRLAAGW